jgi:hypothetical protein
VSHAERALAGGEGRPSSRADDGRARRRRWRGAGIALALAALGWLVATSLLPPLRTGCDATMSAGTCSESVTAALSRGLERPHGLLLAATVAPGPDAAPGRLGHRATVTFDILGAPAPIAVALHLDLGGHWGGVVDRDRWEITMVPIVQSLSFLALGLVAWLAGSAGRRHDVVRDPRRGEEPWIEPT